MYRGALASIVGGALISMACATIAFATSLPTCTISVPPGAHYPGQAIRLLWIAQDATSASITSLGPISPSQIAQGYRDIYLTGNTLLTMTVGNGLGTRTCSVIVTLSTLPVQTQTVYQQVPVTQTQYVPVYPNATSVWYTPQTTWTPFYSTPTSHYTSFYDSSYGGPSYYYSGETSNTYGGFYNTSSQYSNNYYYLSQDGDCYFSGNCGGYDQQYQSPTYYPAQTQDYFTLNQNGITSSSFYDCPPGSANCYLSGYGHTEDPDNFDSISGYESAPLMNDNEYYQSGPTIVEPSPTESQTWWDHLPQTTDDSGYRDGVNYEDPAQDSYMNNGIFYNYGNNTWGGPDSIQSYPDPNRSYDI